MRVVRDLQGSNLEARLSREQVRHYRLGLAGTYWPLVTGTSAGAAATGTFASKSPGPFRA